MMWGHLSQTAAIIWVWSVAISFRMSSPAPTTPCFSPIWPLHPCVLLSGYPYEYAVCESYHKTLIWSQCFRLAVHQVGLHFIGVVLLADSETPEHRSQVWSTWNPTWTLPHTPLGPCPIECAQQAWQLSAMTPVSNPLSLGLSGIPRTSWERK